MRLLYLCGLAGVSILPPRAARKRTAHERGGLDELRISVTPGPAYTLVSLAGECDLNTSRELRDVLTSEVSRGAQRLILDLSELGFMDSAGMQVLMSTHALLNIRDGALTLVSPQPVVARILELTGADQLIPVYDSLGDVQDAGLSAGRWRAAMRRRAQSGRRRGVRAVGPRVTGRVVPRWPAPGDSR